MNLCEDRCIGGRAGGFWLDVTSGTFGYWTRGTGEGSRQVRQEGYRDWWEVFVGDRGGIFLGGTVVVKGLVGFLFEGAKF